MRFPSIASLLLAFVCLLPETVSASGEKLDFDAAMAMAFQNSLDLKIAAVDTDIRRDRLTEIRSVSYPALTLRMDSGYLHSFQTDEQDVVAVGDAVSTGANSRIQNSVTLGFNYLLFSFGAARAEIESAIREIRIAEFNAEQAGIELGLKVLESYSRALALHKQKQWAERILENRTLIFSLKNELRQAGVLGEQHLAEAALLLAEEVRSLDQIRLEYRQALRDLAFIIGRDAQWDQIKLTDFTPKACPDEFSASTHPAIRALDMEIAAKRDEYRMAGRQMLPSFHLVGNVRMYGSDQHSAMQSLHDLEERDATVALVAQWELFSGFKDMARRRRLLNEIHRLELERQQRVAAFNRKVDNIHENLNAYAARKSARESHRLYLLQTQSVNERLARHRIIDRVASLEKEIPVFKQRLELELDASQRAYALLKLKILAKDYTP